MAFEGMATPLGVRPGQRRAQGIPPLWRRGLFALLAMLIAVLLLLTVLRRQPESSSAAGVAVIERASEAVVVRNAPPARAEGAPEEPKRATRQSTPGGGVVIKVPGAASETGEPLYDTRVGERTEQGVLPVVSASGHKAYKLYARNFPATDKPKIAIVLTGVGISARGTDAAIRKLPGEVTLAFAPYGRDLEQQVTEARGEGHEILLQVPMEPQDYPHSDPGPHTLRANDAKENAARLRWLMSRFTGYVGLMNFMGSRLMRDEPAYAPLLEEVNRRGLLFLDDGSTVQSLTGGIAARINLPNAIADRVAETDGRVQMDQLLKEVEQIAKRNGRAIVTIPALPANIDKVAAFAKGALDRGVVLAPISAIMSRNAP